MPTVEAWTFWLVCVLVGAKIGEWLAVWTRK